MKGEVAMRRAVKRALQIERERLGETRECFCFNLAEKINAGEDAIDSWLSAQKCIGGGNLFELVEHFGPGFLVEVFSGLGARLVVAGSEETLPDKLEACARQLRAAKHLTATESNRSDFPDPGAKEAGET